MNGSAGWSELFYRMVSLRFVSHRGQELCMVSGASGAGGRYGLRIRHAPHQGRWRSGRRFRFSRAAAGRLRLGELSLAVGARMDAVFIAVIASSITPSNSGRPCRVWAEAVKTAGSFSNHAEMRVVNAAMFACTVAGVTLSVLVKTKTKGTAWRTSHSTNSRSIACGARRESIRLTQRPG